MTAAASIIAPRVKYITNNQSTAKMLKTKANDDKVDTLLTKGLVPIIDLAHCGKRYICMSLCLYLSVYIQILANHACVVVVVACCRHYLEITHPFNEPFICINR